MSEPRRQAMPLLPHVQDEVPVGQPRFLYHFFSTMHNADIVVSRDQDCCARDNHEHIDLSTNI